MQNIIPAEVSFLAESWSIITLPSLNLTHKLASHHWPDSSLLTGMQNNTCYHTRKKNPRTASLQFKSFHYATDSSSKSCWWNALPNWGDQAAFSMTNLDAKAKKKKLSTVQCSLSLTAGMVHEGELIRQQICWTNTVIIWSSGVFVIKPR